MRRPIDDKDIIWQGDYIRLVKRDGWEFVCRRNISGIVILVPLTAAGELVLVEQYRVPVSARVIELPAGLAGDEAGTENEPLEVAAARELLEETGFRAGRIDYLCEGPPSAGVSSEDVTFYLCTDLVKEHAGGGTDDEDIRVHVVPVADAMAWLANQRAAGAVIDTKIYAGLYFAEAAGRAAGPPA